MSKQKLVDKFRWKEWKIANLPGRRWNHNHQPFVSGPKQLNFPMLIDQLRLVRISWIVLAVEWSIQRTNFPVIRYWGWLSEHNKEHKLDIGKLELNEGEAERDDRKWDNILNLQLQSQITPTELGRPTVRLWRRNIYGLGGLLGLAPRRRTETETRKLHGWRYWIVIRLFDWGVNWKGRRRRMGARTKAQAHLRLRRRECVFVFFFFISADWMETWSRI